jgi:hypothetical protein
MYACIINHLFFCVGMADAVCTGSYGIPVVDSTDGTFKVYYFPIAEVKRHKK